MGVAAFGIGAYTPSEASKLIGVPAATLRHWLFGYRYNHHGPQVEQAPLWLPEYGIDQEEPLLGFRDLLEARIVRGLRKAGIGLPTIRQCLALAREIAGDDHPFSTRRFKTDGARLFLADEHGRTIDLKLRQHVFKRIVEPSFVDLDFDTEAASRWWLLPRRRSIVVDPARAFGQPILAASGVSTLRIAQAVAAEGSSSKVARLFDLPVSDVNDALLFERRGNDKMAA